MVVIDDPTTVLAIALKVSPTAFPPEIDALAMVGAASAKVIVVSEELIER